MRTLGRKVVDAKGGANSLDGGLRCYTFDLYATNRHDVDQKLLAVGSRLRALIDRDAEELQWSAHAALCKVTGGVL